LGFLAIIDGDNVGCTARKSHLLNDTPRSQEDRIAIWAPTWEIETWVLWLAQVQVGGQDVDEGQSYKTHLTSEKFRALVQDAIERWNSPRPDEGSRLPSLADARVELTRIV
jgi:hypothetical protein